MNGGGLRKVGSGWRGGVVVGSDFPLAAPVHTLITVGNVEEKVLFMMLLRRRTTKEKTLAWH